jgi:hypothetical protein
MRYSLLSALVYLGLLSQVLAKSSTSFTSPMVISHGLSHDTRSYTSAHMSGSIMRRLRMSSGEKDFKSSQDRSSRSQQLPGTRKIFNAIQQSVTRRKHLAVLPSLKSYTSSRSKTHTSPSRQQRPFDESVSANTFIAILPPM